MFTSREQTMIARANALTVTLGVPVYVVLSDGLVVGACRNGVRP